MSHTKYLKTVDELINDIEHLDHICRDVEPFVVQAIELMSSFAREHLKSLQDRGLWDVYPLAFSTYLQKAPLPIVFCHRDMVICISLQKLVDIRHNQLMDGTPVHEFVLQVLSMLAYEIGKSRRYRHSKDTYLYDLEIEQGILSKGALLDWYGRNVGPDVLSFVQNPFFADCLRKDLEQMQAVRKLNSVHGRLFAKEMYHRGVDSTYEDYSGFSLSSMRTQLFAHLEHYLEGYVLLESDDVCASIDAVFDYLNELTASWDESEFTS